MENSMNSHEWEVNVWGHTLRLLDRIDSCTIQVVSEDMRRDFHGVRDLPASEVRTILDIGAHTGLFTCLMARHFPNSKIFAVEPVVENFNRLTHNVQENKCENVLLFNTAVSDSPAPIRLAAHPQNSGGYSLFNLGIEDGVMCPATTLSNLLDRAKLEKVDLVKCDIEGQEFAVFKAFKDWDRIGKLTIEVHNLAHLSKADNIVVIRNFVKYLIEKMGEKRLCVMTQLSPLYLQWGERIERDPFPGETFLLPPNEWPF